MGGSFFCRGNGLMAPMKVKGNIHSKVAVFKKASGREENLLNNRVRARF